MITPERMVQFKYLLNKICSFSNLNLSVRQACKLSFIWTSKHFGINEKTVRALVVRDCKIKSVEEFYKCIAQLTEDNILFRVKYYSNFPEYMHSDMDKICEKFKNAQFISEDEINPIPYGAFRELFKKDRHEIVDLIKKLKD